MTGESVVGYAQANVEELRAVVATIDASELESLVSAILAARRIHVGGIGRSGLVAKAIGMRLMHIGLNAFAVGEIATPGIGARDLLLAFTARGGQSVVAQAAKARSLGAAVAVISVAPGEELSGLADTLLQLPIRSTVPTAQHAGSLFEQSCLVIGDAICRTVQERLGVPAAALNERHANLP